MMPIKLPIINPVKTLFTEHLSNGLQLAAIAGVAATIVSGAAFMVVRWVF
jgi:hypothetical protein